MQFEASERHGGQGHGSRKPLSRRAGSRELFARTSILSFAGGHEVGHVPSVPMADAGCRRHLIAVTSVPRPQPIGATDDRSAGESEEHEDRPAKSHEFLVAEPSDAVAELRAGHCRDLVDHEAAGLP